MSCAVWCFAALAMMHRPATVLASPQEPGLPSSSVERIKGRLAKPPAPPLAPAVPQQLRPTFKARVEQHPFVPTLEEDLRKTFALTDFQRQYAEYASRCCGMDVGGLVKRIDKALDERRVRQTRDQIARELAALAAARSAQALVR